MTIFHFALFQTFEFTISVADDAEFCTEVFLPEMIAATENIEIGEEDRQRLFNGLLGTAVKLLYAFLWQVLERK